jgi:ADP-heptose:LPS heptosyltransferase
LSKAVVNPGRSLEPSDAAPRILVIRSGAIGDTLMTTPLFRSLRESFPQSYIAALASQTALDVLKHNPHIDEALPLRGRHLPFAISPEKRRLVKRFREFDLDAILSLETHASFTDLACRIGPKRIITYDPRAVCGKVTHLAPLPDEHSSELHLRAGAAIGAVPDGLEMETFYPPEFDGRIASRLLREGIGEGDLLVGIHAGWGSRTHDPDDTRLRSWPASRFAELIGQVGKRFGAKIVLTGAERDRELNEIIAARSGVPVVNAAGRFSLLESAALIRRMALYVTIDSGPAHIAAAVGTPLITLWGPGIFSATRPIQGKGPVKILREPPPCAPCYGTGHMRSCTNNVCMKDIEVGAVTNAVEEILNGTR